MIDFFAFIDTSYQELIQNPQFASITTGNVPSSVVEGDEFSIVSDKVEFKFSRNGNKLLGIFVHDAEMYSPYLKGATTQTEVREKMGLPYKSRGEKKVPIFGIVGALDKYIVHDNYYIFIKYQVSSEEIDHVLLGREE